MMPVRADRRVRVGDMLTFEFENEETLRYQVQEMVFIERMTDPAEIDHEVELYGRMLPNATNSAPPCSSSWTRVLTSGPSSLGSTGSRTP